ncbi:MAG: hypothetical protein IJH41_06870 [Eubacterium sp.]|nr:hypothetical protein [Eubacterium sp.]
MNKNSMTAKSVRTAAMTTKSVRTATMNAKLVRAAEKIAFITAVMVLLTAVMVLMAGCASGNNSTDGSGKTEQQNQEEQQDEMPDGGVPEDPGEQALQSVVPPEGFDPVGEYQDETSKRAVMTITPEGEEGHYSVIISWGSSAFETTIWEFDGDFDYESGMLSYENCCKYELVLDENDKQQEEKKYEGGKGALMYFEGGFHWDNEKDGDGKDCYFIKIDDLSDTIIEEAEE